MNGLVLVTDATGDVGGRLWRRLEQEGRRVRCIGRRLAGVEAAYYLIHSLGSGRDFEE